MNKSYYYSTPIPSSQDISSSPIFPFLPLFILDLSSMSQLLDKQYSSLPPLEDNHEQAKLIPFFPPYEISSSRYGIPYQASKTGTYSDEDHDHQDDDDQYYPSEESNESLVLRITTPVTNNEEDNRNSKMYSGNTNSCDGTAKWMSSKMRLMRKMMNSYPQQKILHRSSINNSANSSNGCVRACSDCNTTKTPLWRSGPQGPKSLCNACGIRQRKARKAVAAAEKASNDDPCKIKKVSVGSCNAAIPYKKRYKLEQTRRKIQLEDFSNISLKKKTASFHPQDEKEAAILLMALSCDLIYG